MCMTRWSVFFLGRILGHIFDRRAKEQMIINQPHQLEWRLLMKKKKRQNKNVSERLPWFFVWKLYAVSPSWWHTYIHTYMCVCVCVCVCVNWRKNYLIVAMFLFFFSNSSQWLSSWQGSEYTDCTPPTAEWVRLSVHKSVLFLIWH